MKAAASNEGAVTVLLPDRVSKAISFIDYAEHQVVKRDRYGLGWDLPLKGVEFRTNTVTGTLERLGGLTIGDLAPYSIEGLDAL